MTGVEYRNNHPGGISAVVQYWAKYFEKLQFYPTFKEGTKLTKLLVFCRSYVFLFFRFFVIYYKYKWDDKMKRLYILTVLLIFLRKY